MYASFGDFNESDWKFCLIQAFFFVKLFENDVPKITSLPTYQVPDVKRL